MILCFTSTGQITGSTSLQRFQARKKLPMLFTHQQLIAFKFGVLFSILILLLVLDTIVVFQIHIDPDFRIRFSDCSRRELQSPHAPFPGINPRSLPVPAHILSCQQFQVSRQTGRFAGDINDPLCPKSNDLFQCFRMYSVTWRIKDNQIRHFLQLINYFQHITGPEAAVIQFIQCRIFSRCLNRFLDDLDADHFFCYRCRDLGDGACSAVQVKDNFILRISDIFPCCLVQYLGPQRIRLEEGEWCNLEFQSQKFLIKIVLSIQNFCSFIFYRISQAVVSRMQNSRKSSFQR